MNFFKRKLKGISLVELVLAIGIFATISSTLLLLVIDSTRVLDNSMARTRAANVTQSVNSTLLMVKSESWYDIARHTGTGSKHFELNGDSYTVVDGVGVIDGFNYYFTVEDIQRDVNGVVVESGGTVDPHSRLVLVNIEWEDYLGKLHTVSPAIYLNDWDTTSVVFTTVDDFLLGSHTDTMADDINGGEVRLQSMFYADWCNPSLSMTSHDLPGQGIATTISTYSDTVYMGTGGNASGISFMKASVDGDPPVVTNEGTYDGYKVNDVFGVNGNALLATDTNDKEVVILDVSSYPYTVVGFFDAVGSVNADAVYAYEGIGFVGHGSTLSLFSLSSYVGERSLINSVNVGGIVTDIYVDDSYVYMTLDGASEDFVVYDYSSGLSRVGGVDLGPVSATSLFIEDSISRAYVGTQSNSSYEFYVLDISTISSTYPVVSTADTGALNIKGVAYIDNRVILVGTGGEEYRVLDLTDEVNPVRCGGLNLDTGVNALTLVQEGMNNYAYVVTGDSNAEFRIIKGGPGGGGADGNGYLASGTYLSPIFDSESVDTVYYLMSLDIDVPALTSLRLQLRASGDSNMSGASWIGPDGTSSSYYDIEGVFDLDHMLIGRYFQYKGEFVSDTVSTPLIEEVVINYEK